LQKVLIVLLKKMIENILHCEG